MIDNRHYSDEQLTAWLDGEAEFAPIDDITQAAKLDGALAERIEALRVDRSAVAVVFDGISPTKAAPSLFVTDASSTKSFSRSFGVATAATALAACLVMGVLVGRFTANDRPANWMEYVAAYQALYTSDTLVAIERSDAELNIELARVSSVIGKPVALSDLKQAGDLTYRRAQILGFEGNALAQFAFVTNSGVPVALCILRNGEKPSKLTVENMEGMEAASWSSGEFQYLLIGGQDAGLVHKMAKIFQDRAV
ncbi:hypothetical protein [Ahrensia sp. R2A130]|uniref:hypothetical protein n=1 Tax=Ahrensia sp. R2A130 TaxID=744979 RepID=UPI0001E0E906|nr:hypothetical protein [Ahrensia sp. R2A130]EFL87469.1 putative transmembrane anti-sigma factor [Ahrensia sp. R2A130]